MKEQKKSVQDLKKAFFEMKDSGLEPIDLSKFKGPKGIYAKSIAMQDFQEISDKCTILREGVELAKATPEDYYLDNNFMPMCIAASVCDSEENLLFSYDEIPFIMKKSKDVFEAISTAVAKKNGAIKIEEVKEKAKK